MGFLVDYFGKIFLFCLALYLLVSCAGAVLPDTTPTYSSSYSSGSKSSYSSNTKKTPTPTPKPAVKTNNKTSKPSSSKTTTTYEPPYRDVDDVDIDGFYYDNRGDFENEDDAWDYLEDEWDDEEWD